MRDIVGFILGVWILTSLDKYLRLPMMIGKGKKQAFSHYLDHFLKKVEGWGMRFLSMGGRSFHPINATGVACLCNAIRKPFILSWKAF